MTAESLAAEHREIEERLDRLAAAADSDLPDASAALRDLWRPHFAREEAELFPALRDTVPAMVDKMLDQHNSIRELDDWLADLLARDQPDPRDLHRCLRHYLALLQHHLLEEERDLFPSIPPVSC